MSELGFFGQIRDIRKLFEGKTFRVPDYQRTYAWELEQVKDFWNDIREAMITSTKHYWGTITLRFTGECKYHEGTATRFEIFEVVDGQQRITTIYLFLLALSKWRPAIRDNFIKCGEIYRLELGGLNNQFLKDLVDGKDPQPDFKTNRLLKTTLGFFENELKYYTDPSKIDLSTVFVHLQYETFSLEFGVQDKTLAIKAFQSLNDRGKPLTLLDKAKSFLMFYSSRYLNNDLMSTINTVFGNALTSYDIIRGIGESEEINYISGRQFSEDELLRFFYHYFALYARNKYQLPLAYDYDITGEEVFKQFLKMSCEHLKNDSNSLKSFIGEFLGSFNNFVEAFKNIISRVQTNCQYKKLFSFLGLNARLYPLIISLECEKILNQQMLNIIESVDIRIYKIRGTDPRAKLYNDAISQIKINPNAEEIYKAMIDFRDSFMWDDNFRSYLSQQLYGIPAVKYILWELEKNQTPHFNDCDHGFYKDLQIDHILPQVPTFSFPAFDFEDMIKYYSEVDKIGNLTLLEEKINKKIGNTTPQNKINEYLSSNVPETKRLGSYISNIGFNKKDIADRTKAILDFCVKRW